MSTRPILLSLDTLALPQVRDLAAARAADLPRDQHALMSAFGGPAQTRSVTFTATSSTLATYYPSWRVPPGVTDVGIGIRASGNGVVTVQPAADAIGTSFIVSVVFDGDPTVDAATRMYNGSVLPGVSVVGRAVTALAAPVWEFTSVEFVLTIDPAPTLYVYELSFVPIHIPR